MNILVLESDPVEQTHISNILGDAHASIRYETTIPQAINSLGIQHTDLALVDADCNGSIGRWTDLVDFLKNCKIDYAVYSSNGKVGFCGGQQIVAMHDIPNVVLGHAV